MVALGLLAGGAVAGTCMAAWHHYVVRMSQAREWLARGGVLVDVDTAGEFARHHPRVAINVPLEDLARRAHELGEQGTPLVVFAHSWRRGVRATRELRGMGFWEVMNAGGLHTKEKLSAEAARAADARREKEEEVRGVPAEVELAAEGS